MSCTVAIPTSGNSVSFMQVRKRATRTNADHDHDDGFDAREIACGFQRKARVFRIHRRRESAINQPFVSGSRRDLEHVSKGIDVDTVISELAELKIETPSWGYGNSGTRFGVFAWPGAARTVYERVADAALVHRLTGACPTVAIHVTWDRVDDWNELAAYAENEGVKLGAINGNVFQGDDY